MVTIEFSRVECQDSRFIYYINFCNEGREEYL